MAQLHRKEYTLQNAWAFFVIQLLQNYAAKQAISGSQASQGTHKLIRARSMAK
jgi:hypothetical protein